MSEAITALFEFMDFAPVRDRFPCDLLASEIAEFLFNTGWCVFPEGFELTNELIVGGAFCALESIAYSNELGGPKIDCYILGEAVFASGE